MGKSVAKKKVEWQRKTYPLKLKLDDGQKLRLDSFLEEYQKVTQFVINKCINQIFPGYKQLPKQKWKEGKCRFYRGCENW